MRYIIVAAIFIGVMFAFWCVKFFVNKKMDKDIKQKNVIKQPSMYLVISIIGIIVISFYILLIILNYFDVISISEKESIFCIPLFLPVILLSVYLILISIFWKIEIYEDSIMYRNLFGKKKIYNFEDIKLQYKSSSVRVYFNGKKVINISFFQYNIEVLQKAISDYKNKKTQK